MNNKQEEAKCAGLEGCHALEGVMYDFFIHDARCPRNSKGTAQVRANEQALKAALITECCNMAIGPECRFCPKCGHEARLKPLRPTFHHWIAAAKKRLPFNDQMGGHIFVTLHDGLSHNCRVASGRCKTIPEEWALLSDTEALLFLLCAQTAFEQVQRFIAEGIEDPYRTPQGNLVERPGWARLRYSRSETGDPDDEAGSWSHQQHDLGMKGV